MQQKSSFCFDIREAKFFSEELDETSKAKVAFLVKQLLGYNIFSMRYLSLRLKERIVSGIGIDPMKLNIDWPSARASGKTINHDS